MLPIRGHWELKPQLRCIKRTTTIITNRNTWRKSSLFPRQLRLRPKNPIKHYRSWIYISANRRKDWSRQKGIIYRADPPPQHGQKKRAEGNEMKWFQVTIDMILVLSFISSKWLVFISLDPILFGLPTHLAFPILKLKPESESEAESYAPPPNPLDSSAIQTKPVDGKDSQHSATQHSPAHKTIAWHSPNILSTLKTFSKFRRLWTPRSATHEPPPSKTPSILRIRVSIEALECSELVMGADKRALGK